MQHSFSTIPVQIRDGFCRRMNATLSEQKQSFRRIIRKDRTMDAEEDQERKIAYISQQVGVNESIAKSIANYADPQTMPISAEKKSKAESLQGPTVDFVSICFADLCRAASRCVARVIDSNGDALGSGFMISPELFITNEHVISSIDQATDFQVEFNYESDFRKNLLGSSRYSLDPGKFFFSARADELDFCIVAVGTRKSGTLHLSEVGYLPILDSDDKHIKTIFVNCIQHPGGDTKQLVVRESRILARTPTTLIYGSDTQPGSSGSPVFNDDWEVIALHHWGEPYRSLVDQPDGLPENGNEGIRISAIVKHLLAQTGFSGSQQALLQTALSPNFRVPSLMLASNHTDAALNPQSPLPLNTDNLHIKTSENGRQMQSFTIPLTITIQLGAPVGSPVSIPDFTSSIGEGPEATRKLLPDPDYGNRRGYNAAFLGKMVPLPALNNDQRKVAARNKQALPGSNVFELKYQHFSVFMNGQRRMAFFTACNIDGASVITINRDTGIMTRGPENFSAEGAEGGREKWYDDNRIEDNQISEDRIYLTKLKNFHRGHLVKRTDPSWGTESKAYKAQSDTFHFTNCSPQHKNFNPQTSRWAGVENWITKTSNDADIRISVFSGPVFDDDDPVVDYLGIPKAFWKVVAWIENGKLMSTAIIADQSDLLTNLDEPPGPESLFDDIPDKLPEDYHVTIKEVERVTGLSFGTLRDHDILNGNGGESLLNSAKNRKRIYSFKDILKR